ncbi:hypothetical protein O3684_02205 [Pauljensenia sp. 20925_1_27]
MVPADDDHKDTSSASTKQRKRRGLTPMPDWLMHWWTPLLVAAILFGPSLIFAIIWGGQPHWPSSKAMKLCMTITGAGLAFSAWQQRSHDNVVKEKQEQATIERNEYWKRREQIYQLLGSKNPGLRLSAVALLAELADSAAHSSLLNDTEKQQLQRHIIDTLCLQLRHEGLNKTEEGNHEEHAELQRTIINTIIIRINMQDRSDNHADWSQYVINLSEITMITPINISNINTSTPLIFNSTKFLKPFNISDSTLLQIYWETAQFYSYLSVSGRYSACIISIDDLPTYAPSISFNNSIIKINRRALSIDLSNFKQNTPYPAIRFNECLFFTKDNSATRKRSTYLPQPKLYIYAHAETDPTYSTPQDLTITKCKFSDIEISSENPESQIRINECIINNFIEIKFEDAENSFTPTRAPSKQHKHILLHQNTLISPPKTIPVTVTKATELSIDTLIDFRQNRISRKNNLDKVNILDYTLDINNPEPIHFTERTEPNQPDFEWRTGGNIKDQYDDIEE